MWIQRFGGPAGPPPDRGLWAHEVGGGGWGDGQRQVYTDVPANAALDGAGHLRLTARREPDGTITSARLTTKDRFWRRYGRVTAGIRVPGGRGTWPAFWMLGTDIDDVGWPACGEIDVMEHLGADPTRCHGTAHGPGWNGLGGGIGAAAEAPVDLSDSFHEYAVDWRAGGLSWLLDGETYHRLSPPTYRGPGRSTTTSSWCSTSRSAAAGRATTSRIPISPRRFSPTGSRSAENEGAVRRSPVLDETRRRGPPSRGRKAEAGTTRSRRDSRRRGPLGEPE